MQSQPHPRTRSILSKIGHKTPRSTVRGRSRMQKKQFGTLRSDLSQQNPRSRVSNCVGRRKNPVSTCPVPSIWTFSNRKNDNMPPETQERNSKATHQNTLPKLRHATSPQRPPKAPPRRKTRRTRNPKYTARLQRPPKAPAHRNGAQKIRGTGCTSDPKARLLAKNAAASGNHDSNPYQPQKQAKASLSQLLRRRVPSQPLQKRTSSQAGYANRTPASGPGVMEYTSSTCIQHTPLE